MEVRNASAKSGSIGLVECSAMIRPQHATPSGADKVFFGPCEAWGVHGRPYDMLMTGSRGYRRHAANTAVRPCTHD
jgi:hypothetical protein